MEMRTQVYLKYTFLLRPFRCIQTGIIPFRFPKTEMRTQVYSISLLSESIQTQCEYIDIVNDFDIDI